MADGKDDAFPIPWPAVLTIAGIVGAYLTFTSLTTSRPGGGSPATADPSDLAHVEARLWQDPLAAVLKHRQHVHAATGQVPDDPSNLRAPVGEEVHSLAALQYLLRHEIGLTSAAKLRLPAPRILILPVMLQGGPYPENTESRLRQRHAVLSALSVAGYVPRNGERLAYVEVPLSSDEPAGPSAAAASKSHPHPAKDVPHPTGGAVPVPAAGTMPMPYEWLDAREVQYAVSGKRNDPVTARRSVGRGQWDKVLVLWLDDERFVQKPLSLLRGIAERLLWSVGGPACFPREIGFKVIGPRSSGTLRAMWDEALDGDQTAAGGGDDPLARVEVFSATATADEAAMAYGLGELIAARRRSGDDATGLAGALKRTGVTLHRTIGQDWQLSDEIVRELRLRGVEPCTDPVALVGEWDTLYARANVFAFASAASGKPLARLVAEQNPSDWPENITRHTYLRGIDGVLPGDDAPADQGQDAKGQTPGQLGRLRGGPPEMPEGLNQADYLRRLADELHAVDADRRREDRYGQGIRAIGVMGSDVYDKLLVLRALRNRFPNAIFFTTDLDARLVHPSEWVATHNLVIASHFGRTTALAGRRVPPFRDSYQTSVFCAVLAATGDVTVKDVQSAKPRRYEVGRGGEVDISVEAEGRLLPDGPVHAPRRYARDAWQGRHWDSLWVILGTAAALCLWLWERRPRSKDQPRVWRLKLFYLHTPSVIFAVGVVAFGYIALGQAIGPEDEPLLLLQGVSIWPTVALRLLALLLCLHFLYRGGIDLREVEADLTEEFRLEAAPVPAPAATPGPAAAPRNRPATPRDPGAVPEGGGFLWLIMRAREVYEIVRAEHADRAGQARRPRLRAEVLRREAARLWDDTAAAREGWRRTLTLQPLRDEWAERPWSLNLRPSEQGHVIPDRELDVRWLWAEYLRRGSRRSRLARSVPAAAAFFAIGYVLMKLFGFPHSPYRNEWTGEVDTAILYTAYFLLALLGFLVIDATRLCERFTLLLCRRTTWPPEKIRHLLGSAVGDPDPLPEKKEGLDEYLDIQLLARLTGVVGRLVYYPFLAIAILIVARNTYFDNWDWPAALLITMFGWLGVAFVAGMLLRGAAENARSENLKSLRRMLLRRVLGGGGDKGDAADRLKKLIEEIETERRGTFAPFGSQPLLRAFLLPSGGVGLWALLDWYAKSQ